MSATLLDNSSFYGYRTIRRINGKVYQTYYSLISKGKRLSTRTNAAKELKRKAEEYDEELRLRQIADKKQRKSELCFHKDGRVKGINYTIRTEKSGSMSPIFQLGINSALIGKPIMTSAAISAHGKKGAWLIMVDLFCKHKQIKKTSALYRKLLAAMPVIPA